jgi:xanthine dehydrogenase YagS FAD-binding subunit
VIAFPTTPDTVLPAGASWRAGGTDLTERRRLNLTAGAVYDLRDLPGLDAIEERPDGGLLVGARCSVQDVADHPRIQKGWPGLAAAFAGLATPQLRRRATVGGSLLQDARCPYFRSPEPDCLKKGGHTCSARRGEAAFHSVIDLGSCIAPHPSTPFLALLAFDGVVHLAGGAEVPAAAALGDGANPRTTHSLPPGALVTGFSLPPPRPGERSAWVRLAHRARAEWPLAEAVVRLTLDGDRLGDVVLAVGGVANRPLRFDEVAAKLRGRTLVEAEAVVAEVEKEAGSIPQSAWRAPLIPRVLLDALALGAA